MEKQDAKLFSKLCGFCWSIRWNISIDSGLTLKIDPVPLIFDINAEIYNRHEIDFVSLSHLDNIGLIRFNSLSGFVLRPKSKSVVADYYGKPLHLEMPKDTDNELNIGHTFPTSVGQELAPICGSEPVDGFLDYVKDNWKQYLPEKKNKKDKVEEGYAILDELVGLTKSDQTDGSVNHDGVIYGERSK
jgi:hypothetical protein